MSFDDEGQILFVRPPLITRGEGDVVAPIWVTARRTSEVPLVAGRPLLVRRVREVDLPRVLSACAARAPAEGQLELILRLPAAGLRAALGAPPPPARIGVTASGPLAGTPLSRCVLDAVQPATDAAVLPPRHLEAALRIPLTFPSPRVPAELAETGAR